jgi:hypothetical protein
MLLACASSFEAIACNIAHRIGFFAAVAAIAAVVVIVERPSEKSGNQPDFVGAEQQQKRLAVFLDGTCNKVR